MTLRNKEERAKQYDKRKEEVRKKVVRRKNRNVQKTSEPVHNKKKAEEKRELELNELAGQSEKMNVNEIAPDGQDYQNEEEIFDSARDDLVVEKEDKRERIYNIIQKYKSLTNKKQKLNFLDELSSLISIPEIKNELMEIAVKDNYHLCRAKAVSSLADIIHEEDVKNKILETLKDSSYEVRKWAVWALKGAIDDTYVQSTLSHQLLYSERSKKVKAWIINVLSSEIDNSDVQYTFLRLLETRLNTETRELIIDMMLKRSHVPDILYALTKQVKVESNVDIKEKIILKLQELDDTDAQFTLEWLKKTEKDKDILELLQ